MLEAQLSNATSLMATPLCNSQHAQRIINLQGKYKNSP